MPANHRFDVGPVQKGSTKCAGVQQNFLQITAELVPVINPEVMKFVVAQKQVSQAERCEGMVCTREPLRHAHVVRILCLERELLNKMAGFSNAWNRLNMESAICPNSG